MIVGAQPSTFGSTCIGVEFVKITLHNVPLTSKIQFIRLTWDILCTVCILSKSIPKMPYIYIYVCAHLLVQLVASGTFTEKLTEMYAYGKACGWEIFAPNHSSVPQPMLRG